MAGLASLPPIDPVGGIGAALVAGAGGAMHGRQMAQQRDIQMQELLRRREREDFAFNQVKDEATVTQDFAIAELEDFINEEIDPIRQGIEHFGLQATPGSLIPKGGLKGSPVSEDQHGVKKAEPTAEFDVAKANLGRRLKELEADYIKYRNIATEDVARIKARTANDPEAQRRQLAAYKKNLDSNPKLKAVHEKYNAVITEAAENQRLQAGSEIVESLFRGDTEAMAKAGLVNEDGTPMSVVRENGVPVGLQTKLGTLRLRSAVTWGLYKHGLATMKDFQAALKEDQDSWDSILKNKSAEDRARFTVINQGGGDNAATSAMKNAQRVGELTEQVNLIMAADPKDKRLPKLQAELDALKEATPKNVTKGDQADDKTANGVVATAVRNFTRGSDKPGSERSRPSGWDVAAEYENIRDTYGKSYADRFAKEVKGSWGTKGSAAIQQEMDAYWKKSSKPKGLVQSGYNG